MNQPRQGDQHDQPVLVFQGLNSHDLEVGEAGCGSESFLEIFVSPFSGVLRSAIVHDSPKGVN